MNWNILVTIYKKKNWKGSSDERILLGNFLKKLVWILNKNGKNPVF